MTSTVGAGLRRFGCSNLWSIVGVGAGVRPCATDEAGDDVGLGVGVGVVCCARAVTPESARQKTSIEMRRVRVEVIEWTLLQKTNERRHTRTQPSRAKR